MFSHKSDTDVIREREEKKREKLGFEIKMIWASAPRRSISHSTLHHAQI